MGLFKRFCHTDIVGKVYMLVIAFIIIVTIITVVVRYNNKTENVTGDNVTENNVVNGTSQE